MSERLLCPDTTVIIKYFAPDERVLAAVRLINEAVAARDRIVAPATCTEVAPADEPALREYWTADMALLNTLGARRPAYVRELGR